MVAGADTDGTGCSDLQKRNSFSELPFIHAVRETLQLEQGEVIMKNKRIFLALIAVLFLSSCRTYNIHSAVGYQNLADVKNFIVAGVDVNAKDGYGNTPLLLAAQNGNYAIASYLIENGAEVNAQNTEGWTALLYASFYESLPLATTLIEHKANLNLQNKEGWTALTYAVYYGRKSIAKILIENNADVNLTNNLGYNALTYAIQFEHADIAEMLRSRGAKAVYEK